MSHLHSLARPKLRWRILAFALASCLTAAFAWSQEVSSSITGVVTDPSGSTVSGAAVTAKDVARGTTYPTTTNESGVYLYPRLLPGTYELKVEAKGFKVLIRPGIEVEMNQRARVDVALEVGAVTESVQVTGESPLLQTDTTMVDTTYTNNAIVNAPLISRNFISMTLLAPGVTTTNPSGFTNDQRTTGGGRPYVNGNRKEANNFLLDGIDNNQVSDNLTSYQPNPDAIGEVKMITNNASAEFGNFQGGIVNVSMKSGTNGFHGTAFEYLKNDFLNANNWARNWQNLPTPLVRYNSFGGSFGGPIKKDKLFFFVDYLGVRKPTPPANATFTVPDAAFRNGDFSKLLNPASDPSLAGRLPTQLYNPFDVDAAGRRRPFPNNQIPIGLRSPVATNLYTDLANYPLPNTGTSIQFNQVNAVSNDLTNNQGDVRVDWKFSSKDDLTVRYSQGSQEFPGVNGQPLLFNTFNDSPFKAGVINWTRTITPTIINEARAGVNRITLDNGGSVVEGTPNLNSQYGIAGVDSPGLLSLQFTNSFTTNIGQANIGTQQLFANTTYHYADNLTWVKGRHSMKMGGQLLRQQMNTFYAGNNGRTGFMSYSGRWTAIDSSQFAWSDADFYLGLPEILGRGLSSGTWGHRKWIIGVYFQDDWRVTDNLTLNLGIRWENHTPLVEVADRQANFEPFSGTQQLAGQDGNSRALYEPYWYNYQPRFGFAYTPFQSKKAVFRGAYTISSFMEGTGTNLRLPLNPPFNSEFEARYDNASLPLPLSTSSQGLTVLNPADPYLRTNIRLWDPFVRPSMVQQWNLTYEQQMAGRMVGSVAYIGQHGTHLVVPMPYFQRQLQPNGTTLPSPYLSGNPSLSTIAQISGTESNGNQRYDALQATLSKRLSAGLEFQLGYTYSHGLSDAIGYYGEGGQAASQSAYWQNLYDRGAEWGPTYFDARQMFTATYVWDIPIGRGRKFGTDMNRWVDGFIGGWNTSGVVTLRTGFPLTIQGPDNSTTNSRGARASVRGLIPGGNTLEEVGPGSRWFETAPYRVADTATFGTAGVGTERGPKFRTWDVSMMKQFAVTERFKIEIRGEFINVLNTPQFNTPIRFVTSPQFGNVTSSQYERAGQLVGRIYF